jgi:excinuclease UvrABC nuclease subunit
MTEAAAQLDYEHAARLRDQIAAVRSSLQGQQVVSSGLGDQDVIGYYREGARVELPPAGWRAGPRRAGASPPGRASRPARRRGPAW